MSTLREILGLLRETPLSELFCVGFLDDDGPNGSQRFYPMFGRVYLQFGDKYLCCTSIQEFYLQMEIVNEIAYEEFDEDDPFCVCSLYELIITQSHKDNAVTHLRVFTDRDTDIQQGCARCAEFRLGDQGSIFLDPGNVFGVRIGTQAQLDRWIKDNATPGNEFPPGWVYEEHIWETTA